VALASHDGALVAGDVDGNLLVFSASFQIVRSLKFSEMPIKQIAISSKVALILTGDSQVFTLTLPKADKAEALPVVASLIAVSESDDLIPVFDPSGVLYITNFKNISEKIEALPAVSAISFCPDGFSVALLRPGAIGLWNLRYRRLTYFTRPECVGGRSLVHAAQLIIVAAASGIYCYPFIMATPSKVPLLFTQTHVIEYRPTTKGIVPIAYDISAFGGIQYTVSDIIERFIVIGSQKRIGLVSRQSMKLLPFRSDKILIRGLEWHRNQLAVLAVTADLQFSVQFFEATSKGLRLSKTIQLPSRPFSISSDNIELLVVSMDGSLLLVDKSFRCRSIEVPGCRLLLSRPHPRLSRIFGITSKRELVSISLESGECAVLREHMDDVFCSTLYLLVFAVDRGQVLVSSLDNLSFRVFKRRAAAPIWINTPAGTGWLSIIVGMSCANFACATMTNTVCSSPAAASRIFFRWGT
jgi:hypothetical protein